MPYSDKLHTLFKPNRGQEGKNENFNSRALSRGPQRRPENSFYGLLRVRLLMEPNPTSSTMTSELMEKRRVGKSTRNLPKAMSALIFHIFFAAARL